MGGGGKSGARGITLGIRERVVLFHNFSCV